jgi:type I restriction enzyme S subunit
MEIMSDEKLKVENVRLLAVNSPLKKGYKQTDVGLIPTDWDVVNLGELSIKIGSGITPTGGEKVYKNQGRPFLRSQNIGWGCLLIDDVAFIDDELHNTFNSTEIKKGDVLLNITGASIGRSAVADERVECGNVNQHVCIIRTNNSVLNPFFLNNYLLSNKGQKVIDSFQAGGNRQGLNFGQIKSFLIPLPRLLEQRAIAEALSDVNALISSLDTLIAKKRNAKQGALQQLLTGKKRLPGFVDDWKEKKLHEISNFENGKAHENNIDDSGNYIVVNSKFVSSGGSVFKCSTVNLSPLYKDDIVLVMSDIPNGKALAKCFFINQNDKFSLNQRICSIRAVLEDSRFLYYLLNRNKYFLEYDNGVSQTNLRKNEILECKILLPALAEQKAIAKILDDINAEIDRLEQERDKAKLIRQGMMQELLTGKTRLI